MKNSILGKARWLREVALATSKNNGARVAREWLKYAAMFVMLFTIGVGNVWGTHTVVKAGDMVSGEKYIITAEYNSTTYYLAPASFDYGGGTATAYTTSLTEAAAWTFTKSSSSWTITTKIGNTTYYLNNKNANNGVRSSANSQTWTVAATTSGASTVYITGGNSRKLALYQSSNWRCYSSASGVQTITLYKVGSSCTKIGAPTVTATPGDGRIDLSWSNQTGASSYSVTKTPAGGTVGTPSKSGSTWSCAITGLANGTTYTWSVEAVGSGDYCASGNTAASGSATPNVFRTITYYDKDGQHTTSLADGTNIATALTALYGGDDPVSCDATNYEYFVGWKVGEISGTASSVTLLDDEVVNASSSSNNYYAVWSDTDPSAGGWTKVTSIAVGDIVVFAYDDDYKEMTGINASNYGDATAVDPYPDDISGSYTLTIEAGNGGTGYSFKHGSVYLSWSSGNSLTTSGTKDNASSWTISESSSGNFKFANVGTTARILQYNSGSPRWACYRNSGQSAFQIYKQSAGGDAEYITTCCDKIVPAPTVEAIDIHYNQFTLSWTNVTGADGYTVTCAGGTVGAVQSSSTTRTCTITGLASPNTSYSWTVVATYSGSYCGATPAAGSTTTAQVYAVEYNANGGTVSPLPSTVSYEAGVTVTVAAEPGSTSKSGCTFTGWNTQADGQGTHYAASGSATFTMPSSTMTLYAEWTKKKNYYVDRMHGTNDGHTVTIDDVVYNCYLREGYQYTVPTISDNTSGATTCHNEHDHLLFWVTASSVNDDGTLKGGYTEVTPGSSKTATTDGTIYYAIWGKLAD